MRLEGSCITILPDETNSKNITRGGVIRTANPLPSYMTDFSFEICSETPYHEFAVGFEANDKRVMYEGGTGVISKETYNKQWISLGGLWKCSYDKKQLHLSEKCFENDIIKCSVVRTTIGDRNFVTMMFTKNNKILGRPSIEADGRIWPVIAIASSKSKINVNPKPTTDHSPSENCRMIIIYFCYT